MYYILNSLYLYIYNLYIYKVHVNAYIKYICLSRDPKRRQLVPLAYVPSRS